jgi:putative two-component system response regulator
VGVAVVHSWWVLLLVGLAAWIGLSSAIGLLFGRALGSGHLDADTALPDPADGFSLGTALSSPPKRVLVVDDDSRLRLLLRSTLAADAYVVEEASSAAEAERIAERWRPELVVLDVNMPGRDGLSFCRELKSKSAPDTAVILLTGGETTFEEATAAGAVALLRKPFSPLELIKLIDAHLEGRLVAVQEAEPTGSEQLVAYARDLSRVLQAERAQRRVLEQAYRQTMSTLTDVLEARHPQTQRHALRVQRLAVELTRHVEPSLLRSPSLEYGFLLHDIGKIGISDAILDKAGPLADDERELMRQHPLIGEQILSGVKLVEGAGIAVVRSHHERWDGTGYPDGLAGESIPVGARIFAVVDAVDAMTQYRPYREPLSWEQAVGEVQKHAGSQFDPEIAACFLACEQSLRRLSLSAHVRAA